MHRAYRGKDGHRQTDRQTHTHTRTHTHTHRHTHTDTQKDRHTQTHALLVACGDDTVKAIAHHLCLDLRQGQRVLVVTLEPTHIVIEDHRRSSKLSSFVRRFPQSGRKSNSVAILARLSTQRRKEGSGTLQVSICNSTTLFAATSAQLPTYLPLPSSHIKRNALEMNEKMPPRLDRGDLALRRLGCEVGMVNEASGSARYSQGDTVVVAAVYGPGQPKFLRHEHRDGLCIEVSYSSSGSLGGGVGGGGGDPSAVLTEGSSSGGAAPSSEAQCVERSAVKIIRTYIHISTSTTTPKPVSSHSLTHSFTHSPTHSLTHSLTLSPTVVTGTSLLSAVDRKAFPRQLLSVRVCVCVCGLVSGVPHWTLSVSLHHSH